MLRNPALPRPHLRLGTDLWMLFAVLIWAINFTAIKLALTEISPLAFNGLRFALATLSMLAILVWRARTTHEPQLLSVPHRDWLRLGLLGLASHTLYQLLFIGGMSRTGPGNASLLMATSPIWVAVIGYLAGVERVSARVAAGILVSFAGIFVLVTGGGGRIDLRGETWLGDLMIVGCSLLWALGTTASKPMLARYSPLKLNAATMATGTVPLVAITLPAMLRQDWRGVSAVAWGALIFSAVLAVAVGYIVWYMSVQRVGNARTAIYSNLTPVFAILIAWVVLGSTLEPLQFAGAGVVLAGLMLTRSGRRARRSG